MVNTYLNILVHAVFSTKKVTSIVPPGRIYFIIKPQAINCLPIIECPIGAKKTEVC